MNVKSFLFIVISAVIGVLSGGVMCVVHSSSAISEISYGTYIGGTSGEYSPVVKNDALRNTYIVGMTNSTDFPVTKAGVIVPSPKSSNYLYAIKLSPDNQEVYSILIGPDVYSFGTNGLATAVDALGNLYIAAETDNLEFPTTEGAYDRTYDTSDPRGLAASQFVLEIDSLGELVFSTFFADYKTRITAMAVDGNGSIFVAGSTYSTAFPVTFGALQSTYSGSAYPESIEEDGFVSKLSPGGTSLIFSTYVGPIEPDNVYDLAIDSQHRPILYGDTESQHYYSVGNTYQPHAACSGFDPIIVEIGFATYPKDTFLIKLNASGSAVVLSSFLGSCGIIQVAPDDYQVNWWGGYDHAEHIALDNNDNIYLSGVSSGYSPIPFPYTNSSLAGYNFFVKLSSDARNLIYSFSYPLGTGGTFAISPYGKIYVAADGGADGINQLGTPHDFEPQQWVSYPVVMEMDPTQNGTSILTNSRVFGDSDGGSASAISLSDDGRLSLVGTTSSQHYPTTFDALEPHWLSPDLYDANFRNITTVFDWNMTGVGNWQVLPDDQELQGTTYTKTGLFPPVVQDCSDCTIHGDFYGENTTRYRIYGWKKDKKNYISLEIDPSSSFGLLKQKSGGHTVLKKKVELDDWSPGIYIKNRHVSIMTFYGDVVSELDLPKDPAQGGAFGFEIRSKPKGSEATLDVYRLQLTSGRFDINSAFLYRTE